MVTVEKFVEDYIKSNKLLEPNLLIITENCPDLKNYFYNSIDDSIKGGSTNLLDNICRAMGINGVNEKDKLNKFLVEKKYLLIDSHKHSRNFRDGLVQFDYPQILEDILLINPKQILITTIRSNEQLSIKLNLEPLIANKIVMNKDKYIFPSPSNRSYSGFNKALNDAVELKKIIL